MGKAASQKEGFPMFIRLIAVLLVVFFGSKAQASVVNDCIDACFSGFSCITSTAKGMSMHDCQNGRQRCVEQCNGNMSQAALPATGIYGAIAYDKKSGAWGMADTSPDQKSAKKSAYTVSNMEAIARLWRTSRKLALL